MRKVHPDKVLAAIRALARSDKHLSAATVSDMLEAGKVPGVEPYTMPLRTLQDHVQRARRDVEPLNVDTDAAIDDIERDYLRMAQRAIAKIAREAKPDPTQTRARAAREWIDGVQLVRRARRAREAKPPERKKDAAHVAGGKKGSERAQTAPASILDRITKAKASGPEQDANARAREGAGTREGFEPEQDPASTENGDQPSEQERKSAHSTR